jgi:hypothetical protein
MGDVPMGKGGAVWAKVPVPAEFTRKLLTLVQIWISDTSVRRAGAD